MYRKKLVLLIGVILLYLVSGQQAFAGVPGTGDSEGSIEFKGLKRTYRLHVPLLYEKNYPTPLVIVLHGGGMQGKDAETMTGFSNLSEKKGFIVVYPDAVDKSWNDDRKTTMVRRSLDENIDDTGFIAALMDHLSASWNIDTTRVYAAGFSNGGMFTQRLARELTDRISAFASVAAPMPETRTEPVKPSRPIPALFIIGTDDPVAHWEGGDLTWGADIIGRSAMSVPDLVRHWVKLNNSVSEPSVTMEPDLEPGDGMRVRREVYKPLNSSSAGVMLYAVQGGGHTWPGGLQYAPEDLAGKICRDINASEVIWDFFKNVR